MFDESIDRYAWTVMKDTSRIHLNVLRALYGMRYTSPEDRKHIMDTADEQYRRLMSIDRKKVSHETHANLLRQCQLLGLHCKPS